MNPKKRLIAIQGPTASGKTALSIRLANHFQTEIISADSRQFYQEMSIGTAKPDEDELAAAPHHFINSDSIKYPVNVAEFEKRGLEILHSIFQKNDQAILVGGSGMFVDAITKGLDNVPTDIAVREQLIEREKNSEFPQLVQELITLDPDAEKHTDLKNPVRVIRALEVLIISGKPMRAFQNMNPNQREFTSFQFAIDLPREILYDRINQRVDKMMENGLLEEVKQLHPFKGLKSLETVGYTELFQYLEGEISLERAIELIKQNSRRYAKRQMTWLRRNENTIWLSATDTENQFNEIIQNLS